jgi:hypothetical protein
METGGQNRLEVGCTGVNLGLDQPDGRPEVGAPEIGATDVGAGQVCPGEVGAAEVGPLSIQSDTPNPAVPPTKNAETTRTDTSFGLITSILS